MELADNKPIYTLYKRDAVDKRCPGQGSRRGVIGAIVAHVSHCTADQRVNL